MKLSLTRAQAEEEPDSVVLGPWCLPPGQEATSSRPRPPCPWDCRASVREAVERCRASYERLLPLLGAYLNDRLEMRLDETSWRTLLGFWLRRHVQQVEDRRRHLLSAISSNTGLEADYLAASHFRPPRDCSEFMELCSRDDYNWQLFSQLGPLLGLQGTAMNVSSPAPRAGDAGSLGLLKRFLNLVTKLAQPRVVLCDVSLGRGQLLKLMGASRLKLAPVYLERAQGPIVSAPFSPDRLGTAGLDVSDPLDRLVAATLPAHLPTIFLEGYHETAARSKTTLGFRPLAAVSAVGWLANDAWRFAAVQWRQGGTRFIGIQHGAGYGMYFAHQPEEHEIQIVDRYLNWGWADGGAFFIIPDPDLSDLKSRRARSSPRGTILLVSNTDPRIAHNLNAVPVCEQILDYMDLEVRFIRALAPAAKARLTVRPYPRDLGWNHAARLAETCLPGELDDCRADLPSRLCEASLFVCDHPGTPMLEALAADIPSVLFWDQSVWEMRPAAQPFFDALMKAGILFGEPEAAAKAVEEALVDPEAWWSDPTRQEARARFIEKFGRTSADWAQQWTAVLLENA